MSETRHQLINLMPAEYMQRLGDHRERRRFFVHMVIVMICVGLIWVERRMAATDRTERITQAQQRVNMLQDVKDEFDEVSDKIDAITQEIAHYQRLSLPIDMSRVIATVSNLIPDGVQVTTMRLWTQEVHESRSSLEDVRKRTARSQRQNNDAQESHRYLSGEFTGLALSGIDVSTFLSELENHPLFSRVQLDYSRGTSTEFGQVREFRINFNIDLEVRYLPKVASVEGASS